MRNKKADMNVDIRGYIYMHLFTFLHVGHEYGIEKISSNELQVRFDYFGQYPADLFFFPNFCYWIR